MGAMPTSGLGKAIRVERETLLYQSGSTAIVFFNKCKCDEIENMDDANTYDI